MEDAIRLIPEFWRDIFGLLDRVTFEINGYIFSLGGLLLVMFITGIVITIFWKGGKA